MGKERIEEGHPENLSELLIFLLGDPFEEIKKAEPDVRKIRKFLENYYPEEYSKEDVTGNLEAQSRAYLFLGSVLRRLMRYGDTREKAVQNLKAHVKECETCTKEYFDFIAGRSAAELRLMDTILDEFEKRKGEKISNTEYKREDLQNRIKENDRKLLGLIY